MAKGKRRGGETKKVTAYLRQCVRPMLKGNHGNENCRNICQLTDQHLTRQQVLALQSCCMEGESVPKCQSLKALRRRERDLVLQTRRHGTRMLNINKEVLMV